MIPVVIGLVGLAMMPKGEGRMAAKQRLSAMVNAWRGIGLKPESTSTSSTSPEPEVIIRTEERIVERVVPAPPPELPSKWVPWKEIDTATLFNGLVSSTTLNEVEGGTAAVERENDAAYGVEIEVKITVPTPATRLEEFEKLNPHLPKVLPAFSSLLEKAAVSGFYHKLYENKRKRIQRDYTRFNKVLDRHNFYDCDTILEMRHPDSGRRVLLLQSEMDVVSDGTDGDRMPNIDDYVSNSPNYQPATSYMWRKKTEQPNPLLKRYTDAVARDVALLKERGLSSSQRAALNNKLRINRTIADDLRAWSYLIAEADPFVVLPSFVPAYKARTPYAPQVGDYAVVIYEDRIFPAIVGDLGPTYKAGEGSLRLCKELNPKATVYSRPESDLEITYIYFPGSAEKQPDAPDLQKWHSKCAELLGEIGGIGEGYQLHRWSDPFKTDPQTPSNP